MKKLFTFLLVLAFITNQNLIGQTFNWTQEISVNYATGVTFDTNDDLWYIIQGSGLFEYSGGISNDHSAGLVTTGLTSCDSNGDIIWTGGYGGLTKYDGTVTNYSYPGDLQGYAIYDVDVVGNDVWLAMENEGASHYDGSTWTHYNSADGIIGEWHTCIDRDNLGNVWQAAVNYSTGGSYVNKYDGSSWTSYTPADGITLSEITSIFADSYNNIWIAGDGVMMFDGSTWTSVPVTPSNNIYCIYEDNAGNMWFGDISSSVYMYDGVTVHDATPPSTFGGRTDGIKANSAGEVYFCLGNGIYTVDIVYSAPPVTDFNANTTTVCLGDAVDFTDLSSNAPTSWLWDFGDGNTSTLQNPTHTYAAPGTYTVTLTSNNSIGSDNEIKTNYIVVSTIDATATQVDEVLTANATGVNYQWVDCNAAYTPIAGENNQSFTATMDGSYAVIVSDGVCTDTSACMDVTITDINETFANNETKIFPNPAKELLNIESPDDIILVEIYSISGKKLLSNTYNNSSISINLEQLPKGQYLIRLTSVKSVENILFSIQ